MCTFDQGHVAGASLRVVEWRMLHGRVGIDLPDQLARSLSTVTMTFLLLPLQSEPAESQQMYVDHSRDQSFEQKRIF